MRLCFLCDNFPAVKAELSGGLAEESVDREKDSDNRRSFFQIPATLRGDMRNLWKLLRK